MPVIPALLQTEGGDEKTVRSLQSGYTAKNNRRPVANKVEGEDGHPKMSSALHTQHITYGTRTSRPNMLQNKMGPMSQN